MRRLLVLIVFATLLASGARAAEPAIEFAVTVNAPVAEVWKAWTTSEGIVGFFAPEAVVEAKPGGAFHIYLDPYADAGLKGADEMTVLAIEPEKLLSFTWNAPPSFAEVRPQRTVVMLRLTAEGNHTQVQLSHLGWGTGGEWPKARAYFEKAWPNVLKQLQSRFDTGKPQDWTAWREQLKQWHRQDVKKN